MKRKPLWLGGVRIMKGANKNLFRQFGQWTPFRFQEDLDSFLRITGSILVFKGTGKKKLTDIGFLLVFRSETGFSTKTYCLVFFGSGFGLIVLSINFWYKTNTLEALVNGRIALFSFHGIYCDDRR